MLAVPLICLGWVVVGLVHPRLASQYQLTLLRNDPGRIPHHERSLGFDNCGTRSRGSDLTPPGTLGPGGPPSLWPQMGRRPLVPAWEDVALLSTLGFRYTEAHRNVNARTESPARALRISFVNRSLTKPCSLRSSTMVAMDEVAEFVTALKSALAEDI